MRRIIILFTLSFLLLVLSFSPMFNIIREIWVEKKINILYDIEHAYEEENGFRNIIDVQELMVNAGSTIKIKVEHTGKKAPLTEWDKDENVPAGDIVKVHLLMNDIEITDPEEIWLSNRNRGSRYFSWLDVLTVTDRVTGEEQINIVQRLTDDHHAMEKRKWKLITINEAGDITEEVFNYQQRSDHQLGVSLVNFSNTGLMAMGYYSDILTGYPSLIFPLLYPIVTSLAGIAIMLIIIRIYVKRRRR